MDKKKFTPWTYVVKVEDTVLGAFTSVSMAYGHWLAYAEKYSNPDDPFVHCSRYRYCMKPYEAQQEDVTMLFIKQWQVIRDTKKEIKQ